MSEGNTVNKPALEGNVEEQNGIIVVTLIGPVDSATLDIFQKTLDSVSRQQRAKVLIDCSQLTYMNSRAVGLLTSYRRQIYAGGGRLALSELDKKIVRTLDLLGLGKVIKTYPSRDEAVAAMS